MADSAPQASQMKESSVCGADCFTALSALNKREGHASHHGPALYGPPSNSGTVTLKRQPYTLPESVPFGDAQLKPLRGGEPLGWRLVD